MNIENDITQALKTLFGEFKKGLKFDKTTKARVLSVNDDNTYTVQFWGKTQNVKCNNTKTIKVNDAVWVLIPQGNLNNAFIL